MTLLTEKWQGLFSFVRLDSTVSEDASELREASQKAEDDYSNSASIGLYRRQLLEALVNAFEEAGEENWDGYGASAADPRAYEYAVRLLSQFPTTIPRPDIAIDVDGHVALEWDFEPRRIVSVRVGGDGTIYYAGLLGYSTFHGSEVPSDSIPDAVAQAIDRVLNATTR